MMLLQVTNGVLAALMGGGLLIVQVAVVPTFHRVPDAVGARLHLHVDRYIEYSLPAFTILTAACALVRLAAYPSDAKRTALMAAGTAATVLVAAISHLCNRRLNVQLRSWPLEPLPGEYSTLRVRWDRFHLMRTLAGVGALACFVLAGIGTA
jgi:hypothetical protein